VLALHTPRSGASITRVGIRTIRVEFAERVQQARRDAGLTILQLSDRSGISYNTLRRRLLGDPGQFTIDELDAIADATGESFEYLISGRRLPASQAVAS
jgi:transcriptional regulator with XRE-family HTH domain